MTKSSYEKRVEKVLIKNKVKFTREPYLRIYKKKQTYLKPDYLCHL